MVAGHLQEKKGLFYIVLNYNDGGKRKSKWIPTKLPVKGNKKKAETMLLEARKNFVLPSEANLENEEEMVVEEKSEQPYESTESEETEEDDILFADFMVEWLEMIKYQVEITTHSAYSFAVNTRIVPYFRQNKIYLKELQPKHLHDFYQYVLKEFGLTTNTVLHYHANIRQALQHAFEMDMLPSNPADKVKRLKKNQFIGSYYTSDELNELFEVVKGDPVELAVILAAFYGLRRSEIVGLKWDAINFQHQTFTIKHTVIPVSYQGKQIIVAKDRAKNKSSYRTLPLVPVFLELLLRLLDEQQANRALYKNSYSNQYQDYIYINKLGERIKPGYITQHFPLVLKKHNLRRIRFHDLRHSCASLLLANGVSLKEIQAWLGHSHYSTTANIYVHLEYSSKLSSAQVMSNTLQIPSMQKAPESPQKETQELVHC
ncbi:Site-specific recombinase XerD [Paenibacillus sophorae]|uniref:Site-specific recombinase XerD n=2 Tax=Paenibacillus sophorae TaxID=1333845 RepID=A0A1H8TY75_9BACL|nr:tyrosine-type recombinase/integrase [Paenibacillus sophorae]QWU18338.1 tyrosine-type recombinase/integrase [Paenibacillus sophorae]SEO95982.1 Site-specific recombinase XerD [Paenibacillus sophorae]